MNYCLYCSEPVGARSVFCDATCREEHEFEQRENALDNLPGESRYADSFGEPDEWDVVGGL